MTVLIHTHLKPNAVPQTPQTRPPEAQTEAFKATHDSAYTPKKFKTERQRRCLGLIECLCWKLFSDCGVQKTKVHKGGKKQS